MNATLLYPAQCFLGEGPFWHAGRESCFWVDIENRRLFEYPWSALLRETGMARQSPPPGAATVWQFDRRANPILPDQNSRAPPGMQGRGHLFQLPHARVQMPVQLDKNLPPPPFIECCT